MTTSVSNNETMQLGYTLSVSFVLFTLWSLQFMFKFLLIKQSVFISERELTKMSSDQDLEKNIARVEEIYNSTRIANDKKLNKLSKQLEFLEITIRKINSSKKKENKSKGLSKVKLYLCMVWIIKTYSNENSETDKY